MLKADQLDTAFTANLMCVSYESPLPVMVVTEGPGNLLVGAQLADTGWLCLPEQSEEYTTVPVKLRFDFLGGSEKNFWRQREHNPQKSLRTVETSFFYLFLSGVDIYWKELQPLDFFLKVNAEDKKYSLKVNAKRKNT